MYAILKQAFTSTSASLICVFHEEETFVISLFHHYAPTHQTISRHNN